MHLGVLATPIAFLIAIVKALLVMAFFMGLKYDVKGNRLIFATGFFFLGLLFFFCALDIWTRVFQGNAL
ncbi:MAG: cytochrome C oxidase subunit IV family protein, partial [Pseudobdellovibrionaceae bacterium]